MPATKAPNSADDPTASAAHASSTPSATIAATVAEGARRACRNGHRPAGNACASGGDAWGGPSDGGVTDGGVSDGAGGGGERCGGERSISSMRRVSAAQATAATRRPKEATDIVIGQLQLIFRQFLIRRETVFYSIEFPQMPKF